jgi:L-rhamnose mutarotase
VQRLCFSFNIQPGTFDEYKRRHDEIWPDLVTELKAAGLSNYSLFADTDERIIGYVECEPDADTSFAFLANADANTRWSEWFADIIISDGAVQSDDHTLREVWHLA